MTPKAQFSHGQDRGSDVITGMCIMAGFAFPFFKERVCYTFLNFKEHAFVTVLAELGEEEWERWQAKHSFLFTGVWTYNLKNSFSSSVWHV
jgi:hypothetical protein